jgi:DNA-3-methyladenine glycosylase II
MMTDDQITAAEVALAELDPQLGELIARQGHLNRQRPGTYFGNLTRSIVGQQLSVTASHAILARLKDATGLEPDRVLTLSVEDMRALGLSRPKAGYIRDLAGHFVEEPAIFNHLEALPDEEVTADLIKVKGIGVWTTHMFLMFTLGRPDVFAPDDVGLQRAIQRLLELTSVPPRRELDTIAERWRPYRTVASWHLWESLDNTPGGTT